MRAANQGHGYNAREAEEGPGLSLNETWGRLRAHLSVPLRAPLVVGLMALGSTYLIAPTFMASTIFLPPQQAPSSATSALASLGALGGLAGSAPGVNSPSERHFAVMQSVTISDSIFDHFKLMDVYDAKFRADARKDLVRNVRITLDN